LRTKVKGAYLFPIDLTLWCCLRNGTPNISKSKYIILIKNSKNQPKQSCKPCSQTSYRTVNHENRIFNTFKATKPPITGKENLSTHGTSSLKQNPFHICFDNISWKRELFASSTAGNWPQMQILNN
jgi:hypothetical protein